MIITDKVFRAKKFLMCYCGKAQGNVLIFHFGNFHFQGPKIGHVQCF